MPFEHMWLARLGYSVFKDAYRYSTTYVKPPKKTDTGDLERHVTEIETWSGSINMFGMAKPLSTDDASIAISISTQPRKFFSSQDKESSVEEYQLITALGSFAVLGDPGSGKTTVIKRLVRSILLNEPKDTLDTIQFPLVILGRNIKGKNSLYNEIFERIGFSLNPTIDDDASKASKSPALLRYDEMKRAVCSVLAQADTLIFIDGLDEVDSKLRIDFEKEVAHINNIMIKGKVIITCRSGDWQGSISDFNVVEMQSLSNEDIRQIVALWADEPNVFMKAISMIPYRDILDRPLFLTMLVIVYNQTGDLPDNPIDVYHRVTNLLIEKWDSQRGVTRATKYEGFLPEKKFKFLCALAFHLTTVVKQKRFTSYALRGAVNRIGPRFNLPEWDSDFVVHEIESHTGIIVESGFENFEFCHLTVQEFLSANYLVTMPNSKEALSLLDYSPATVAVAACLSGSPQDYLLEILSEFLALLYQKAQYDEAQNFEPIKSFVTRLRMERPVFVEGDSFAEAGFFLLYAYDILAQKMNEAAQDDHFADLDFMFESKAFVKSAQSARRDWNVYRRPNSNIQFELGRQSRRPRQSITLSAKAMAYLSRKTSLRSVVSHLGMK